ncbi:GNAT family N-acetyltransferase [Mycetocola manganoxydans]|uniref:GNAT family N-acetyltransferase n=1 Tax=Mycetocola manganoxydans TaxID=699879 RepID=A0A3L6ZUV6_9MICO|nr:GNAT family N-acetyltransferase [Mycetocola manganoxydans]RLP71674.1 GNAT family N-acetyltransferase [Mycetocola manganoxydans]GHD38986.1 N-acetyltransferase [Mycetocola manganoxydans]
MTFEIRPVKDRDFFNWLPLFAGYGEFYGTPVQDEKALLVWSWISEKKHDLSALVAQAEDGSLVGLAHYRTFARPLAGGTGIYIDDLFVSPDARGTGIATALIEHVTEIARAQRSEIVRWVTAPDNDEAQVLYDKVAKRTEWITYDLTV